MYLAGCLFACILWSVAVRVSVGMCVGVPVGTPVGIAVGLPVRLEYWSLVCGWWLVIVRPLRGVGGMGAVVRGGMQWL